MVQRQYDHQEDYTAPYVEIGIHQPLSQRFFIGAAVMSLGSYKTRSDVTGKESLYEAGGRAAAGEADDTVYTRGGAYGAKLVLGVRLGAFEFSGGVTRTIETFSVRMEHHSPPQTVEQTGSRYSNGRVFGAHYHSGLWSVGFDFIFTKNTDKIVDSGPSGMGDAIIFNVGHGFKF